MMREKVAKEPNLYDLVPYEYALWRWQQVLGRNPDNAYDKRPPAPVRVPTEMPECPVCHMPSGSKGFIRMCFPIGHELFGKAICCPRCWPAPFGMARNGTLSKAALKIELMWEKVYRDVDFIPRRDLKRIPPRKVRQPEPEPEPQPAWVPPADIQQQIEEVFSEATE